jgi:predicted TIM-barrel fold metal-dependent hydrolase
LSLFARPPEKRDLPIYPVVPFSDDAPQRGIAAVSGALSRQKCVKIFPGYLSCKEEARSAASTLMIIDFHTHIGDLRSERLLTQHVPISVDDLIARLDDEGIDQAVVLPWPMAPEAVTFPGLFSPLPDLVSQIRAAASRPERLIPFGNVDPRWGGNSPRADFSWLFARFREMGCRGIGEVTANIPFDDPRVINLFRQCGAWKFPVTIESAGPGEGRYGFVDEVGSPHLERLLQEAPETVVIGHGPGFWADMGAGITTAEKSSYPKGPIVEEGSVPRLLRAYPQLHADISAGSGFNALTRDPDYGVRFLNEFQDKLLFGTDVCFGGMEGRTPHLAYLRQLRAEERLSPEAYDKITHRNALRLLALATA